MEIEKKEVLFDLLDEREEVYGELTTALLSELENVLDGITLFFDDVLDGFVWNDVIYEELHDVLVIHGKAKYSHPIIDVDTGNGSMTVSTIDDDGNPYFRDVNVGIPINLALTGQPRDIYDFLIEVEVSKSSSLFTSHNSNGDNVPVDSNDGFLEDFYNAYKESKRRTLH